MSTLEYFPGRDKNDDVFSSRGGGESMGCPTLVISLAAVWGTVGMNSGAVDDNEVLAVPLGTN